MPRMPAAESIADNVMPDANPHTAIYDLCLHDLLHHWQKMRGDRLMPGWRDIDPVALKHHLPDLWAWTYDTAQGHFTGRLAGERVNSVYGKSLRHVRMIDFFAPADYQTYFDRYRRVVDEPSIAVGYGPVKSQSGRHGTCEQLILPLASDGLHGDGLIGATIHNFHLWQDGFSASSEIAGEVQLEMRYFPLLRDCPISAADAVTPPLTPRAH